MLIEADKLLMRARNDGLTLQRAGAVLNVRGPKSKLANWAEVLKQHKPALLDLLPDETQTGVPLPGPFMRPDNFDLFYDLLGLEPPPPLLPRRGKPGNRKATATGPRCPQADTQTAHPPAETVATP